MDSIKYEHKNSTNILIIEKKYRTGKEVNRMKFEKSPDGLSMTVKLSGEIDSINAPNLEEELLHKIDTIKNLTFDMTDLEYVSSAGLRVLLSTQKLMKNKNGNMIIKNVNDEVMDVFKVTGFIRLFTIT